MVAKRFHVGEYLADELEARGWTTRDCAERMEGDVDVNTLALDLLIACAEAPYDHAGAKMRLGDMADGLAQAFGTSAEVWTHLDNAYHGTAK